MTTEPWDLDGVFDADYLRFYAPMLDARGDGDAELVARLGGIDSGSRVLDAPCGHGRIAVRLAALGADVVGIDRSALFVERARADAAARGVEVELRQGDLRSLDLPAAAFDVVVNWFTSFGYFDDVTDRGILAGFAQALRPGGRLVLETINREVPLRTRVGLPDNAPAFVIEDGDDLLIDRVDLTPLADRTRTERIIVSGGRVRRTAFVVRLFTPSELEGWMRDAGFAAVAFHGDDGEPFTWRSRRLIAVATR